MSIFSDNTYTPNLFFDDSQLYYKNDNEYPRLVFGLTNATIAYMFNALYGKEVQATSLEEVIRTRRVKADINAGSDIAMGDMIQQFKTMLPRVPVTAYNIDEHVIVDELKNYTSLAGKYYRDDKYIHAYPIDVSILFISFFGNAHDYDMARKLLYDGVANTLTRIDVPFYVDGQLITMPADLSITIEKATYPHEFELFLQRGNIYDLAHTCTLRMHDLVIEGSDIQPVLDANLYLESYRETYLDPHASESSITFSYPTIVSTTPASGDIDVAVDSNISIQFSEPMSVDSIYTNFQIRPYIGGKFTWDDIGQTVTFDPKESLSNSAEYIVTIDRNMENGRKIYMENDVSFSFTTVA